jgi:hypothetical protein
MRADHHLWICRTCACLAFVALISAGPASTAQAPPKPGPCDPKAMMLQIYMDNLARALAESEQCVADSRSKVKGGATWAENLLPMLDVGHYLSANAQILAMMDSFLRAESSLSEAEQYAASHADYFGNFLVSQEWQGTISVTRGFILERQGRTADALAAYGSHDVGRPAVIALAKRDDLNAERLARIGGAFRDATAIVVRGSLAELSGNAAVAWVAYHEADLLMRETFSREGDAPPSPFPGPAGAPARTEPATPRFNHNNFMPIALAEHARLAKGLQRLASNGSRVTADDRGRRRFFDAKGVLFASERWPHALISATVKAKQEEYNSWIATDVRRGIGGAMLVPQYPRFFAGFTSENRAAMASTTLRLPYRAGAGTLIFLPERIEPTGVLDRDTLAIPFYRRTIELLQACAALRVGLDEVWSATPPVTNDQGAAAIVVELRGALDGIRTLYDQVQQFSLMTSRGNAYTGWDEARGYASFVETLKGRPVDFDNPPDLVTAHVDPDLLSPEFLSLIGRTEQIVQAHMSKARELGARRGR